MAAAAAAAAPQDAALDAKPLPASYQPPLVFSPLRISTMTTTGHVGATIDLAALFAQVDALLVPPHFLGPGVLKMEFKQDVKGASQRDIMAAPAAGDEPRAAAPAKKTFFNQATLVLRWPTGAAAWKEVNIKLFHNGGVQMTGVHDADAGRAACNYLLAAVHAVCTAPPVFGAAAGAAAAAAGAAAAVPALVRYDTQMVNSDYSVGAPLLRERLHRILVETYGLFSTFEPTVYQGVNTKFFYNAARPPAAPPGICVCPALCDGAGRGDAVGACKRITVSLFQTGGVIITGARSVAQLEAAYAFINGVLARHAADVVRRVFVAPPAVAAAAAQGGRPATGAAAGAGAAAAAAAVPRALLPHPHPRHLVTVPAEKVVENLPTEAPDVTA